MQALVLEGRRDLQIRDVPEPEFGARDVLMHVKASGICGSDVNGYDGSTGRRIPPLIMGYEAAGLVAQVGSDVRSIRVGDRVTFDSTVSCGNCSFCRVGDVNLCDKRQVLGVSCGDYCRNGAFAEYVCVPERIVCQLHQSFAFEKAALIEAVSIAVHAAKITNIKLDNSAVVVGTGMIGLLAVQALRVFGCTKVIAVDLEESKLALAKELGADEALLAADPDLMAKLQAATGGQGPDIAVEVVGAQKSIVTAIEAVRRGGTVTPIGTLPRRSRYPCRSW